MRPRCSWFGGCAALCALLFLSSRALAGGVRIVDATGLRNFPDIQSAIDAAVDGDVLLVGAGTYPGFTIDGKSLSIFGVPAGALVVSTGAVSVRNVLDKRAALCGLSGGILTVENCSGSIGVQDCSFHAPVAMFSQVAAGNVDGSVEVVLSRCSFVGGDAPPCLSCSHGSYGGDGLHVAQSTIAIYDCSFRGGKGAFCCTDTGDGGAGAEIGAQSWVFAARCSFTGGDSGDGSPPCWGGTGTWCGNSGTGLRVFGELHALSNEYASGSDGANCCVGGGSAFECLGSGAVCDFLPGAARSLEVPFLSLDRAPWSLTLSGRPRDALFLNRSLAPVFQYEPALSGVCTSRLLPFPSSSPLGLVPLSGSLALDVSQRPLPDGVVAQLNYLQGYVVDPAGTTTLGTPQHVLSLNWNSLPDCNANGINDYAEVIAGITPDANHDLEPDGCP
jgi:hypothetical protein